MDNRPVSDPRLRLARPRKRARGSILWERLWPALAALATAVGLFLALSWAGLWLLVAPVGRAVGAGIFGLLVLAAVIPFLRLRVPSHRDALNRVDKVSGEPDRPATALTHTMAANAGEPIGHARRP